MKVANTKNNNMNIQVNETVRKDGLRIISCRIPNKRSVLVELVARVGSAYDPAGKSGLFHCFEHMAFKGTRKRSAKELQSFGGRNFFVQNAYTGVTGTTYVVTIDRRLPLACEYLCDIYFNSVFPAGELKKEKGPILLEIARCKDSDNAAAHQALCELLYRENPLRLPACGTIEGVKSITRDNLMEQKKKWHVPSNTLAIAVGNVNHKDFVKEVSKRIPFSGKKVSWKQWSDESSEKPAQTETIVKRPERKKTTIGLACKIPVGLGKRTLEALSFYNKIMVARGGDSVLWNEIRAKRGLAYFIDGGLSGAAGVGNMFYVNIEAGNSNYRHVIGLAERFLARPVVPEKRRFETARAMILDAFEVEAAERTNFQYWERLIWRNIVENKPVKEVENNDKERINLINRLTIKDVEEARKKFIRPENFARAVVVPGKNRIK